MKTYECICTCHTNGHLHCEPCCEKRCPACKKNVTYFKGHLLVCNKLDEYKKKTKRKVLKQEGIT